MRTWQDIPSFAYYQIWKWGLQGWGEGSLQTMRKLPRVGEMWRCHHLKYLLTSSPKLPEVAREVDFHKMPSWQNCTYVFSSLHVKYHLFCNYNFLLIPSWLKNKCNSNSSNGLLWLIYYHMMSIVMQLTYKDHLFDWGGV